jgi:WD40 repeat-containing protein SMU1
VYLNTVENQTMFLDEVRKGHWDRVLRVVSTLKLARSTLEDLYEQVTLELLELRELETARALLRRTKTMALMRQEKPERYLRLEHLLTRSTFDARELFGRDLSREQRREKIARGRWCQVVCGCVDVMCVCVCVWVSVGGWVRVSVSEWVSECVKVWVWVSVSE